VRENDSILITGGTGFVGSHLTSHFLRLNQSVHLLVRPNSNLQHLDWLNGAFHLHIYDGTTASVISILQKVKPRCVFHLASVSTAEHSSDQVEPLILSNVLLGTQMLEAMTISGVKSIISVGTFWQHYNSESYRPSCLYAATKQAFEDILEYYADAKAIKAITLKLFDTYGPHDSRNKLFSQLRRAASTGITLQMSPGGQKLDLVFIDDIVEAFVQAERNLLATTSPTCKVFGVSSGHQVVLRDLVAQYSRVIGKSIPIKWGARPYREREIMTPWSPRQHLPGWSARTGLDEGMKLMEDSLETVESRKGSPQYYSH
jgi:nucleoside-diphosphate-sugar epimerase